MTNPRPIYTDAVEFEVKKRIFGWASEELTSEVRRDFPLMCRLWNGGAEALIEMLSVHSPEDRITVAQMFLESMYAITTPSEKSLEVKKAYLKRVSFAPLGKGINERVTPMFDGTATDEFKLDRKEILSALTGLFAAKNLGMKVKAGADQAVAFSYQYGDWDVSTGFFVRAGAQNVLQYHHYITDRHGARLVVGTNYPRILAVGEANWSYMKKADLSNAIETIGLLIKRFYDAVPEIVRDIPQDYRTD